MTTSAPLLEEFGGADVRARTEAWRYSANALRALERSDFGDADPDLPVPAGLAARWDWAETRGRRLVFVNGRLAAAHCDRGALAGAAIEPAAETTALKFAQDLALLHLVYVSVPAERPTRWSANLHLQVEAGALHVIEQHVGAGGADVLGVLRSTLAVATGARAQVTALSNLPESASLYRHNDVRIGAAARHDRFQALFGGRLQRHESTVRLDGAQAGHRERGAFVVRGREHADVHLDVLHAARDTASDIDWRGVADQRARGILHGGITVAAGADGADARLQTKNLLLSAHAEIDAQPVLEINADEVKASHGATVGQLDERALFYLRSRGVPAALARRLLIAGFCREVFVDLDDAGLRGRIETLLDERLPAANEVQS
jgi:Fe-S cluster assembly protein SufD